MDYKLEYKRKKFCKHLKCVAIKKAAFSDSFSFLVQAKNYFTACA